MKKVTLKPAKEKSLLRKHPWVFSGAIKNIEDETKDGDIVEIYSNKDNYLATGHYNEGNITVRIFDFEQQEINDEYWRKKIKKAYDQRLKTIEISPSNNVYRLVHAEGDQMPGFICDIYDKSAIFQFHSIGMWKHKEIFTKIILELLPLNVVYDKSEKTLPKVYIQEFKIQNSYLFQDNEVSSAKVTENGNEFIIDWENGQKTGFFIDQRENRQYLGELAKGKKILNTFCYSGGFSIYALNNGAKEVHSLDSSQKAIDLLEENLSFVTDFKDNHRSIIDDAKEYMKNLEEQYDIIILDPPAFAKHMKVKHKALQGYKRLNTRAIEQIKSNGILFTFSYLA